MLQQHQEGAPTIIPGPVRLKATPVVERTAERELKPTAVSCAVVCAFLYFLATFLYFSISSAPFRDNRKLSGSNSGYIFSDGELGSTFKEDIAYILSIVFQLEFQRKIVEIKQDTIIISHRNCQTMEMLAPAFSVTQHMMWGRDVVDFFHRCSPVLKTLPEEGKVSCSQDFLFFYIASQWMK